MLRTTLAALRALSWAAVHGQGWLLSWFLRGKWRTWTQALDYRRPDGSSRPPLAVTLRVTMRCNLLCRMCHVVHSQDATARRLREVRDMPLDLALRLVDELGQLGTYLCLSGGEPLLYKELPAVIRRARDRGVVTTMATNGTLLAERAEELVTSGLKVASISLLGPEEVHNDTVARAQAFAQLAEGVRAMDRAKARHKSLTPITVINCPMTDLNATRLTEMAEIISDWPVAAVNFQHMWFKAHEAVKQQAQRHGGLLEDGAFAAMGEASETSVDTEALADQIEALYRRRGRQPILVYPPLSRDDIRRYYLEPLEPLGFSAAVCLWLFTMIHPNGEVSPCEGFNAGNLNDQSLMEVWNGEKLRAFRRTLRETGTLPVCRRCCVFFRRN